MNYRNLSFIIVLFLVWLMGYYYYSPQLLRVESQQEQVQEIDMATPEPLEAPDTAPGQPEVMPQPTVVEVFAPSVAVQTDIQPAVQPSAPHKKKRTKKEKKQSKAALVPVSSVVHAEPTPVLPSKNNVVTDTVTLTSGLAKKDIGYYKMLSWHYPHLFNLTVNGQPLFTKNNKEINSYTATLDKETPLVVRYDYEWHTPWGKRIGAKKVTFKAHPDAQNLAVRFMSNWKNEERIVVDGATKVSAEVLEEEAP